MVRSYYLNAYLAYPYFIPTRDTCTVQGCTALGPASMGEEGARASFFCFINDELSHITPRVWLFCPRVLCRGRERV